MKSIGIVTIHRIYNYGSVLQAYALQQELVNLGYNVEIIDYLFPNEFQAKSSTSNNKENAIQIGKKERFLKYLYGFSLFRQHKEITRFLQQKIHLSEQRYHNPEELKNNPPKYDIYVTGSDQVWNPRHCKGDPSFMLHFAPNDAKKVAYAASIGVDKIEDQYTSIYKKLLKRYDAIGVREQSGEAVVEELCGKHPKTVLDPTLLLNAAQWNHIIPQERKIKQKYILCYYLNYTFNAFPYADDLARHFHRLTGWKVVCVGRPPHELKIDGTKYMVGVSPEQLLQLVRDAELVLTTSFHGTAFSVNFSRPVFSLVQNNKNKIGKGDSRQTNLLNALGLGNRILSLEDKFPNEDNITCDYTEANERLENLRRHSMDFLTNALKD